MLFYVEKNNFVMRLLSLLFFLMILMSCPRFLSFSQSGKFGISTMYYGITFGRDMWLLIGREASVRVAGLRRIMNHEPRISRAIACDWTQATILSNPWVKPGAVPYYPDDSSYLLVHTLAPFL